MAQKYDLTWRMDVVRFSGKVRETLEGFVSSAENGTQIPISEKDEALEGISMLSKSQIEGPYIHLFYPLAEALTEIGDSYIQEEMKKRFSEDRLKPLAY